MPERQPPPSMQPSDQHRGASVGSGRSPQQAKPPIAPPLPPAPPPNPLYLAESVAMDAHRPVVPESPDRVAGDRRSDAPAGALANGTPPASAQLEAILPEKEQAIAELLGTEAWSGGQSASENLETSPGVAAPTHPSDRPAGDGTTTHAAAGTDEPATDSDATTLYRRHADDSLTYFNYYFEEENATLTTRSSAASSPWAWKVLGTGAVAATVVSGLMIGDAWQNARSPEELVPKQPTPTPGTDAAPSAALPQGSAVPTPAAPSVAPERLPTPPAPSPTPPAPHPALFQAPAPEMPPLPRQSAIAQTIPTRIAPPEQVAINPTPARSPNLPPPPAELRPPLPPPAGELRPPLPPPPDMTLPPLPPSIVPVTPPALPPVASAAAATAPERPASSPTASPTTENAGTRRHILHMSLAEAARYQAELAGETRAAADPLASPGEIAGDRGTPASTPMPPDRKARPRAVSNASPLPVISETTGLRRMSSERSPDTPTIPSGDRDFSPSPVVPPRPSSPPPVPSTRPVAIPESAQSRGETSPSDGIDRQRQWGGDLLDFVKLTRSAPDGHDGAAPPSPSSP